MHVYFIVFVFPSVMFFQYLTIRSPYIIVKGKNVWMVVSQQRNNTIQRSSVNIIICIHKENILGSYLCKTIFPSRILSAVFLFVIVYIKW